MKLPRPLLALALGATATASSAPETYSLPEYPGDTSAWGRHVQRTVGLLAASHPERREPVRILFYGQSIVGGRFHKYIERDLRARFPHADLTIENRAIGGFAADLLVRTAAHDVLVSRPDLVVFAVYGDHRLYEEIIHFIRSRTAAELMLLTHHWRANEYTPEGGWKMGNYARFIDRLIPLVAQTYEAECVDVRWPWQALLQSRGLTPAALLADEVHLNEDGLRVMADLVSRQLLHRPELLTATSRALATDHPIARPGDPAPAPGALAWSADGTLTLEFTGSRIDALTTEAGGSVCEILIDGKPPSAHPELWLHGRMGSLAAPDEWPEVSRVTFETIPGAQDWTLTLTAVDAAAKRVEFTLEGSVTGPDGAGRSDERFVSPSGRVVIEPQDWIFRRKGRALAAGEIRPGQRLRWRSFALTPDQLVGTSLLATDQATVLPVVDGLPNARHTLTLRAEGRPPPIHALRVYTPARPAAPFTDLGLSPEDPRVRETNEVGLPTSLR